MAGELVFNRALNHVMHPSFFGGDDDGGVRSAVDESG